MLGKIYESKYRVPLMFILIFGILGLCTLIGFFLVPTSKKSKVVDDNDWLDDDDDEWLDDSDFEDIEDSINIDK